MPDHIGQAHDGKGRYVRTLTAAQKDAAAADLRSKGWTYQRIAEELEFADRGEAHHAVGRVLKATLKEPGEAVRTLELERLDAELERLNGLEAAVHTVLAREHITVSNGKVIYVGDEPLLDDAPVLQAVDRLLKIEESRRRNGESRRKLLGLDEPAKTQVTGTVQYEIVGVDMSTLR